MTFIIAEPCVDVLDRACVDVCPVDCFHEGPNFLVISDECIDCNLCIPECPAEAIYDEDDLPDDQLQFRELNLELAAVWPNISSVKEPLVGADEQNGVAGKLTSLEK